MDHLAATHPVPSSDVSVVNETALRAWGFVFVFSLGLFFLLHSTHEPCACAGKRGEGQLRS